jgi:hypothetical protein
MKEDVKKIQRGNWFLNMSEDGTMTISDPHTLNVGKVKVDSDGKDIIYTVLLNNSLYTGASPIELLETVSRYQVSKPSDEYMEGFNDGTASVDQTTSYNQGYADGRDKGYGEAMAEVFAYLKDKLGHIKDSVREDEPPYLPTKQKKSWRGNK